MQVSYDNSFSSASMQAASNPYPLEMSKMSVFIEILVFGRNSNNPGLTMNKRMMSSSIFPVSQQLDIE